MIRTPSGSVVRWIVAQKRFAASTRLAGAALKPPRRQARGWRRRLRLARLGRERLPRPSSPSPSHGRASCSVCRACATRLLLGYPVVSALSRRSPVRRSTFSPNRVERPAIARLPPARARCRCSRWSGSGARSARRPRRRADRRLRSRRSAGRATVRSLVERASVERARRDRRRLRRTRRRHQAAARATHGQECRWSS